MARPVMVADYCFSPRQDAFCLQQEINMIADPDGNAVILHQRADGTCGPD